MAVKLTKWTSFKRFARKRGHGALPSRGGFSLIEIVVVVGIIGILAALAIQNYVSYQTKAKHAAVKASLRDMSLAQENYYHSHLPQRYTQDITKLTASGFSPSPNVMVLVLYSDGIDWLAKARYIGTREVFTYDSANGGLQSEVIVIP